MSGVACSLLFHVHSVPSMPESHQPTSLGRPRQSPSCLLHGAFLQPDAVNPDHRTSSATCRLPKNVGVTSAIQTHPSPASRIAYIQPIFESFATLSSSTALLLILKQPRRSGSKPSPPTSNQPPTHDPFARENLAEVSQRPIGSSRRSRDFQQSTPVGIRMSNRRWEYQDSPKTPGTYTVGPSALHRRQTHPLLVRGDRIRSAIHHNPHRAGLHDHAGVLC